MSIGPDFEYPGQSTGVGQPTGPDQPTSPDQPISPDQPSDPVGQQQSQADEPAVSTQPTVSAQPKVMPPTAPMVNGAGMPSADVRQPRQLDLTAVPALRIEHLHKSFSDKHAVNDLSLAVPPGCLFGLVGPNGAGKTTTLSMCTGLLRPDYGTVQVWGHDVWSDPVAAKATMGVLPDGLRLFDRLSGREMLAFAGQMRGLKPAAIAQRSDALLAVLGLTADADTMIADYSAGMTKKMGLACALLHNPRLLVLDEPFEGVDPVSGQAIREILHEFVDAGGTAVMSSHVMELVESLCDAVAVVSQGRILAVGTLEEVRQGRSLQQRFLDLVGVRELDEGSLSWLGRS